MGANRRGKTVKEMTPREILDAIDKALEQTAARLATEKPRHILRRPQSDKPATRVGPKTPKEILDAIDKALEETASQFADRER
jgi:chorismate mutase